MSSYTDSMVAEMTAQGEFSYDTAKTFADANSLSVRSVISKVKNLGLPYTPKVVVKSEAVTRITKAEIVEELARNLNVPFETVAGLSNAPMKDLVALVAAIPQ
jgi:hypothetical protein